MKLKLLIVTLALAIAFTGSAVAEPPDGEAHPARVLKVALNLDDEQLIDLRDIIESRAAEVKTIKEEVHELQAQLEELVKSDDPDPAEVGGLVLDIRTLKQEIGEGHAAYQQSFRDILTSDQVERLSHISRIALADRAGEVLHKLKLN